MGHVARRLGAVCAVLAGCGRIAFDSRDADAGLDAIDAPRGPFCASLTQPVTFCSDFTKGDTDWGGNEMIGGNYVVEPAGGPTPADGALVVTTQAVGSPEVSVYTPQFAMPTSELSYSFDVRIDTVGASSRPVLGLVTFTNAGSIRGVEYVYAEPPNLAQIEEFDEPMAGPRVYDYDNVGTFPASEWHRVAVRIQIGTPWKVTSTIDGIGVSADLTYTLNGPFRGSFGIPYVGTPGSPWVIRVTNVIVDVD